MLNLQVLSVDPQVSGSNGWWVGRDCYGNVGVFPANYVQLQESVTEAGNECLRNSSFELSSSLQEYNSSSFYVDSTLVSSHIAGHSVATDSSLGTGGESDGDVRVRQQTKLESLAGALSHLRLIKYEDIALGEVCSLNFFTHFYSKVYYSFYVLLFLTLCTCGACYYLFASKHSQKLIGSPVAPVNRCYNNYRSILIHSFDCKYKGVNK